MAIFIIFKFINTSFFLNSLTNYKSTFIKCKFFVNKRTITFHCFSFKSLAFQFPVLYYKISIIKQGLFFILARKFSTCLSIRIGEQFIIKTRFQQLTKEC